MAIKKMANRARSSALQEKRKNTPVQPEAQVAPKQQVQTTPAPDNTPAVAKNISIAGKKKPLDTNAGSAPKKKVQPLSVTIGKQALEGYNKKGYFGTSSKTYTGKQDKGDIYSDEYIGTSPEYQNVMAVNKSNGKLPKDGKYYLNNAVTKVWGLANLKYNGSYGKDINVYSGSDETGAAKHNNYGTSIKAGSNAGDATSDIESLINEDIKAAITFAMYEVDKDGRFVRGEDGNPVPKSNNDDLMALYKTLQGYADAEGHTSGYGHDKFQEAADMILDYMANDKVHGGLKDEQALRERQHILTKGKVESSLASSYAKRLNSLGGSETNTSQDIKDAASTAIDEITYGDGINTVKEDMDAGSYASLQDYILKTTGKAYSELTPEELESAIRGAQEGSASVNDSTVGIFKAAEDWGYRNNGKFWNDTRDVKRLDDLGSWDDRLANADEAAGYEAWTEFSSQEDTVNHHTVYDAINGTFPEEDIQGYNQYGRFSQYDSKEDRKKFDDINFANRMAQYMTEDEKAKYNEVVRKLGPDAGTEYLYDLADTDLFEREKLAGQGNVRNEMNPTGAEYDYSFLTGGNPNIDLHNLTRYDNGDGTTSTVDTSTYTVGDSGIIVNSFTADGQRLSKEELDQYVENLKFKPDGTVDFESDPMNLVLASEDISDVDERYRDRYMDDKAAKLNQMQQDEYSEDGEYKHGTMQFLKNSAMLTIAGIASGTLGIIDIAERATRFMAGEDVHEYDVTASPISENAQNVVSGDLEYARRFSKLGLLPEFLGGDGEKTWEEALTEAYYSSVQNLSQMVKNGAIAKAFGMVGMQAMDLIKNYGLVDMGMSVLANDINTLEEDKTLTPGQRVASLAVSLASELGTETMLTMDHLHLERMLESIADGSIFKAVGELMISSVVEAVEESTGGILQEVGGWLVNHDNDAFSHYQETLASYGAGEDYEDAKSKALWDTVRYSFFQRMGEALGGFVSSVGMGIGTGSVNAVTSTIEHNRTGNDLLKGGVESVTNALNESMDYLEEGKKLYKYANKILAQIAEKGNTEGVKAGKLGKIVDTAKMERAKDIGFRNEGGIGFIADTLDAADQLGIDDKSLNKVRQGLEKAGIDYTGYTSEMRGLVDEKSNSQENAEKTGDEKSDSQNEKKAPPANPQTAEEWKAAQDFYADEVQNYTNQINAAKENGASEEEIAKLEAERDQLITKLREAVDKRQTLSAQDKRGIIDDISKKQQADDLRNGLRPNGMTEEEAKAELERMQAEKDAAEKLEADKKKAADAKAAIDDVTAKINKLFGDTFKGENMKEAFRDLYGKVMKAAGVNLENVKGQEATQLVKNRLAALGETDALSDAEIDALTRVALGNATYDDEAMVEASRLKGQKNGTRSILHEIANEIMLANDGYADNAFSDKNYSPEAQRAMKLYDQVFNASTRALSYNNEGVPKAVQEVSRPSELLSKIRVSNSGEWTLVSDNGEEMQTARPKGFKDTEKGRMVTVSTKNGDVDIKVTALTAPNDGMAAVMGLANQCSDAADATTLVNAFYNSGYADSDADTWVAMARDASLYASFGGSAKQITDYLMRKYQNKSDAIGEAAMKVIVKEGKKVHEARMARRNERQWKKGETKLSGLTQEKDGRYKVDRDGSYLTDIQQVRINASKAFAEKRGYNLVITAGEVNEKGVFTNTNGMYNIAGNTIFVDAFAGLQNLSEDMRKNTILGTFGHETGHFVASWNAKDFWDIGSYMMDMFLKGDVVKATSVDELFAMQLKKLEKSYKAKGRLDEWNAKSDAEQYEEAYEEIICEGFTLMYKNQDLMKRFAKQHENMWQRIIDFVKDLADDIKSILFGESINKDEAAIINEFGKEADALVERMLAASEKASEIAWAHEGGGTNTMVDTSTGEAVQYQVREKDPPKTYREAYKLFNVDEQGNPHALFIDAANALQKGTWYDADSPLIKDMEGLEAGHTYYVDRDGNSELRQYNNKKQTPSKAEINAAAAEGGRYIYIGTYGKGNREGQKSYYNWGINGSGGITQFAMRPGWHITDNPSARHIGAMDKAVSNKPVYRKQDQRWFMIRYAADVDYNEEAAANTVTHDIQTHIPTDGWYQFQTNTNADGNQNWIISGSIMIVGAVSEADGQLISELRGIEGDLPYKDNLKAFDETDALKFVRDENGDIVLDENGIARYEDPFAVEEKVSERRKSFDEVQEMYNGIDLSNDSSVYTYDFLTSLPSMQKTILPDESSIREDNGKIDRNTIVDLGLKNAAEVGFVSNGKTFVKNNYTGHELRVDNKSLRHSLNGDINRMAVNSRFASVAGSILKNAVPINALYDTGNNVTGTYAMASYAEGTDGNKYVGIVTVEIRTGDVQSIEVFHVAHSISARHKKSSPVDYKSQGVYPSTATTISIADLIDDVNSTHRSILSKDVLDNLEEERPVGGYYTDRVKFQSRDEHLPEGTTVSSGAVVAEGVAEYMNSRDYHKPDNGAYKEQIRHTDDWYRNHVDAFGEDERFKQSAAMVSRIDEFVLQDSVLRLMVPHALHKQTKFGPMRENVEYRRTFDMDTDCNRAHQYRFYRNSIEAKIGRKLTEVEARNLIELMRAYGQMIPCTYCYVEGKRIYMADEYLRYIRDKSKTAQSKGYTWDRMYETTEKARSIVYGYLDAKYLNEENMVLDDRLARDGFEGYRDFRLPIGEAAAVREVCEHYGIKQKQAVKVIEGYVAEWHYKQRTGIGNGLTQEANWETDKIDELALTLHKRAMNFASSSSQARGFDNYEPYTGNLSNLTEDDQIYINSQGGFRKHSSNDFQIQNVQDYMMFFIDMESDRRWGRWLGHTYSKNLDYARVFGRTHDKINLSIAYDGYGDDIRPNEQEGVNHAEAKELQKQFDDVGVMAMVTNDDQLSHALNDPEVSMIIPFHASGMKKALYYDVLAWFDYTNRQHEALYSADYKKQMLADEYKEHPEKFDRPFKKSSISAAEVNALFDKIFPEYGSEHKLYRKNKKGKVTQYAPKFLPGTYIDNYGNEIPGHDNDVEKYKQLCREYGVKPRFMGIQVQQADGTYCDITDHPGYLKVLKETARTDTPQLPIEANFDTELIEKLLAAEKDVPAFKDDYGIVDEFVREYAGKDRELGYLTERAQEYKELIAEAQEEQRAKAEKARTDALNRINTEIEDEFEDAPETTDAKEQSRENNFISDEDILKLTEDAVARNDNERQLLKEYKGTVGNLTERVNNRDALRQKVAEMEAVGNTATDEYRKAKNNIDTLTKSIDRFAKKTAELENNRTLKDMLNRIRKATESDVLDAMLAVRNRGAESIQDALEKQAAEYEQKLAEIEHKLKNEQLTRDFRSSWAEDKLKQQAEEYRRRIAELRLAKDEKIANEIQKRHEAVGAVKERQEKNKYRERIKKLRADWDSRLAHPRKGHMIPPAMIRDIIDALDSFDDSFTRDGEVMVSAKVEKMRAVYTKYRTDEDFSPLYNKVVDSRLTMLEKLLDGVKMKDLTLNDLKAVYETMRAMHKTITEGNRMKAMVSGKTVYEFSKSIIDEMENVDVKGAERLREYLQTQLSPDNFFDMLAGFKKDSDMSKIQQMFVEGEERKLEIERLFYNTFSGMTNSDEWEKLRSIKENDLVDVGLKNEYGSGEPIKITRAMMLSLYMHLSSEDNFNGIMRGGLNIPDLKQYYKGHIDKAYGSGHKPIRTFGASQRMVTIENTIREANTERITSEFEAMGLTGEALQQEVEKELGKMIAEQRNAVESKISGTLFKIKDNIEAMLTPFEKELIAAAHEWNDHTGRDLLNQVSMDLYGFKKAEVENYFPIHRDKNFIKRDFESISRDFNQENVGFMQDRVKASQPVYLTDFNYEMDSIKSNTAQYVGFVRAQRDFNLIYNGTMPGFTTSVKETMASKFGTGKTTFGTTVTQYLDNYVADIVGARQRGDDSFFSGVRKNMPRATLSMNLRVAFSQLASIPTGAAEAGYRSTALGVLKGLRYAASAKGKEELAQKNIYYWQRYKGEGGMREFADAKENGTAIDRAYNRIARTAVGRRVLNWCQDFDCFATAALYGAAESWADSNTEYAHGSEEWQEAVDEKYKLILRRTQPMYITTSRSDIMRSTNELMKIFTMYKTQASQNLNTLYGATERYKAYSKALKANDGSVTQEDVNEARKQAIRSWTAIPLAAITFAGLRAMVNLVMGAVKRYRDKDKDNEITLDKILEATGMEAIDSLTSMIWLGGELYDIIEPAFTGGKYYGISETAIGQISELMESANTVMTGIKTMADGKTTLTDTLTDTYDLLSQVAITLGIPVSNFNNFYEAVAAWYKNIETGTLFAATNGTSRKENTFYTRTANRIAKGEDVDAVIEDAMKVQGKERKDIVSKTKSGVKALYKQGDMDREAAMDTLEKLGVKTDTAYWELDKIDYKNEHDGDDEGYRKTLRLEDAIESGSDEAINKEISELRKYASGTSTKSQVTDAVVNLVRNGRMLWPNAEEVLKNYGGYKKPDELYWAQQEAESEDPGWSKHTKLWSAMDNADNTGIVQAVSELKSHGVTKKSLASSIKSRYIDEYLQLKDSDPAACERLLDMVILPAYAALGYSMAQERHIIASNWK